MLTVMLLTACATEITEIAERPPTKSHLAHIKSVSIETSSGDIEVQELEEMGPGWVGGMLIGAIFAGPIGQLAGAAAGSLVDFASTHHSMSEDDAQQIISPSWVKQQMLDTFQQRITEAGLFYINEKPSTSDAAVSLNAERLEIVSDPQNKAYILFLTGNAAIKTAAGSILWQNTTTVGSNDIQENEAKQLLQHEFRSLIDKLSRRLANELIYAKSR